MSTGDSARRPATVAIKAHGTPALKAGGDSGPPRAPRFTLRVDDGALNAGKSPHRRRGKSRGKLSRARASPDGSRRTPSRRRTPARNPRCGRFASPHGDRWTDRSRRRARGIARRTTGLGEPGGMLQPCLARSSLEGQKGRSGAAELRTDAVRLYRRPSPPCRMVSRRASWLAPTSVPSRPARRKGLPSARPSRPWGRSSNLTCAQDPTKKLSRGYCAELPPTITLRRTTAPGKSASSA